MRLPTARSRTLLAVLLTALLAGCPGGGSGASDGGGSGGTATDGGGSGSTDGGPTDGGVDRSGWPPGLGAIVDGLPTLAQGGTVDLGDGQTTITTTVSGGDRTEVVSQNGTDVLTIDLPASGAVTATGDLNGDGAEDYTFETQIQGATVTQVETWDTNFDGTLDDRVTTVIDGSANTLTVTEATFDLTSGTWSTRSTYTGPRAVSADPHVDCNGQAGFPSDTSGKRVSPLGVSSIQIVANGTQGACSPADAKRIASAVRMALINGLPCISSANPALGAKLLNAVQNSKLLIGCGNSCTGELASTQEPNAFFDLFSTQHMNLNMPGLTNDATLESILLHEMLHWAGQPHVGGPDGNGGTDVVYACGRYCDGCHENGTSLGAGHPARDCAACSDPAHKSDCGTQVVYQTGTCSSAAICHKGFNNAPCNTCLDTVDQNCDGTPQLAGTFDCCAACPSGYTNNDMPCSSGAQPGAVSQACGTPPGCP